jgi:hypothetical protein
MTRPLADVERVAALDAEGLPGTEIARRTGIPWSTLQKWRRAGVESVLARRRAMLDLSGCECRAAADPAAYALLLGLYLGDGTICRNGRNALRLEIACDAAYPGLIDEAAASIAAVLPVRVNRQPRKGSNCVNVKATSVHWACLFPQRGPGRKHERRIALEAWQVAVVQQHTREFIRGLLNSDGCRVINKVGKYNYIRYQFSNRSDDILRIFAWACDLLGIEWRSSGPYTISVSRRASVEILEAFVGRKV